MSKEQLEEKYGINIEENGYWNWQDKYVKLYDMYSADGCCWEKGFKTIKAVAEECRRYNKELLNIKKAYEEFIKSA